MIRRTFFQLFSGFFVPRPDLLAMTDLASHPPQSLRFRRDLLNLERRAGVWLRDFNTAAARPDFSIPRHLEALASLEQSGRKGNR